jgi:hypothetical protein
MNSEPRETELIETGRGRPAMAAWVHELRAGGASPAPTS